MSSYSDFFGVASSGGGEAIPINGTVVFYYTGNTPGYNGSIYNHPNGEVYLRMNSQISSTSPIPAAPSQYPYATYVAQQTQTAGQGAGGGSITGAFGYNPASWNGSAAVGNTIYTTYKSFPSALHKLTTFPQTAPFVFNHPLPAAPDIYPGAGGLVDHNGSVFLFGISGDKITGAVSANPVMTNPGFSFTVTAPINYNFMYNKAQQEYYVHNNVSGTTDVTFEVYDSTGTPTGTTFTIPFNSPTSGAPGRATTRTGVNYKISQNGEYIEEMYSGGPGNVVTYYKFDQTTYTVQYTSGIQAWSGPGQGWRGAFFRSFNTSNQIVGMHDYDNAFIRTGYDLYSVNVGFAGGNDPFATSLNAFRYHSPITGTDVTYPQMIMFQRIA